jgi:transcriptional regulator with XRE-family HTH domain
MDKATLKLLLKLKGVYQYQIAERLGMGESTLSKKLSHDLTPELETSILEDIKVLKND